MEKETLKALVAEIENVAETCLLTEDELKNRSNWLKRILELERFADVDLKQKACIKWTVDGDENTSFYHGFVNNHNRKNHIDGLIINGRWSTEVEEIKEECSILSIGSTLTQLSIKWDLGISGEITINSSPTKEFKISKGVRQGDPLSPFLFIIAMEGLNVSMKSAGEKNIFKGIKFSGEWCRSNMKNLSRILHYFHMASGLKVNFYISKVYGVGSSSCKTAFGARILDCDASLTRWKAKTLSFVGRLTLITYVLGNLPTYYLFLFKAPLSVIEKLEKI
uniref:Reverse transcriptase domain-containing protein n=1 Tax=Lactuca sativa TaxID=4236 RepID=A0A9R1WW02_LACSA|nr:hypothetical protein LSAT_V11C800439710 [Lactuca sativa]